MTGAEEAAQRPSRHPRRILVAGVSGSGKTTLARRASARLGLPHVEIDSLYHGPGWTPRESFLDEVSELAAQESWVVEWQYAVARPLLLERATELIWLDLPTWRTMWQVVRRTVTRRVRRQVLWNGNREGPLWRVLVDDEHIIRWAWRTRHKYTALTEEAVASRPDLVVVRLRSHREARAWLESL